MSPAEIVEPPKLGGKGGRAGRCTRAFTRCPFASTCGPVHRPDVRVPFASGRRTASWLLCHGERVDSRRQRIASNHPGNRRRSPRRWVSTNPLKELFVSQGSPIRANDSMCAEKNDLPIAGFNRNTCCIGMFVILPRGERGDQRHGADERTRHENEILHRGSSRKGIGVRGDTRSASKMGCCKEVELSPRNPK